MTAVFGIVGARLRPLFALLLGLGFCTGAARADRLDEKLNAEAPRIVESLRQQGVKNVGVLRFRVKEGDGPESFTAGALNGNLAVRLENILVMHSGTEDEGALGVIRDAGLEAARRQVGDWHDSEAERRKLFAVDSYPLAWGSRKVKADALLTGLVRVSGDYRQNTVVIEALRPTGKSQKLAEFAFEGDPALLLDLGKSYSLSKRSRETARTPDQARDLVFQAVRKRDTGTESGDDPVVRKDAIEVGGVEFQLLGGDQAAAIKRGTKKGGTTYRVTAPESDQDVVFRITNKSDRTVGVDVKLNGTSLLFEQTDEPAHCRVWVLKPEDRYRSYSLKGYYYQEGEGDGLKIAPFKVLIGDEARKARSDMMVQLADKVGTISVTVFEEGTQARPEMLISARGLKKRDEPGARADRAALQRGLMTAGRLTKDPVKRDLIIADKEAMKEAGDSLLRGVEFKRNPVAIGSATLVVQPKLPPPVK